MRPEIVSEISGNHNGSLENCLELIRQTKLIGADRIKFQRFDPDRLAKRRAGTIWEGMPRSETWLAQLYRRTETPLHWWPDILKAIGDYAWSCSVFSGTDLLAMNALNCPMLKLASYEMHDLDLIHLAVSTRKPLVISIHPRASRSDVSATIDAAKSARALTLLSATPYEDLSHIQAMQRYDWLASLVPPHIEIGLSDHSPADDFTLVTHAVSRHAAMIERHLCLPDIHTADSGFSSTPEQFSHYIQFIRDGAEREISKAHTG
jgi:sialic acid synthase SpsE